MCPSGEIQESPSSSSSSKWDMISHRLIGFLSEGLCTNCTDLLKSRLQKLASSGVFDGVNGIPEDDGSEISSCLDSGAEFTTLMKNSSTTSVENGLVSNSSESKPWSEEGKSGGDCPPSNSSGNSTRSASYRSAMRRMPRNGSAVKQPIREGEIGEVDSAAASGRECADDLDEVGSGGGNGSKGNGQSREWIRFSQVGRKKDFVLMERFKWGRINVLEGLELHTRVFSAKEQENIVNRVHSIQKLGREGKLRERTYSEPRKWMRGKGRVTMQFGCCYNYATDKNGNPPGIIRDEEVDPLPLLFKSMIRRMVEWYVLPPSCIPNSCIVNIYDEGDCIPPHIDHHDFVRPFCTVSFLAECNILFGHNLEVRGPGEFSGPVSIPLPIGSILVLNGNGADVAKHCVPGVPAKRISITFRKMDDSKVPFRFSPDPELQGIRPLPISSGNPVLQQVQPSSSPVLLPHQEPNEQQIKYQNSCFPSEAAGERSNKIPLGDNDFPPLRNVPPRRPIRQ